MSPQYKKKKVKAVLVTDGRVSVTEIGQKYVSPAGRHSQKTHQLAIARGATEGHATEKDQQAHDRTVVAAGIQKVADRKKANAAANAK